VDIHLPWWYSYAHHKEQHFNDEVPAMSENVVPNLERLKTSIRDISKIFGINPEVLYSVMVGCASRGKADWTRETVVEVILMIRNGLKPTQIIEGMMREISQAYLH
jgi:hypothetical protein